MDKPPKLTALQRFYGGGRKRTGMMAKEQDEFVQQQDRRGVRARGVTLDLCEHAMHSRTGVKRLPAVPLQKLPCKYRDTRPLWDYRGISSWLNAATFRETAEVLI
jgi:hypothetical protein